MSRLGMAILAGTLSLCLVTGVCVRASAATARPPTIETVIVASRGEAAIEGEGTPGNVVRLMSGDARMGEARVAPDGRWRIVLKEGLASGTYQIRADALAGDDAAPVPGDEIRVAVPAGIGTPAVVAYNGGGRDGEVSPETRRRAEGLAEAAGQAFEELVPQTGATAPGKPAVNGPATDKTADATDDGGDDIPPDAAPPAPGPLAVVVDWLKRSARAYRDEITGKLTAPASEEGTAGGAKDEEEKEAISAADAARRIGEERRQAEAARARKAEAEAARKAAVAREAAAAKAREEDAARRRAEDLARRKAEADKSIARELEALQKARAEADAKAAAMPPAAAPPSRPKITLEPFMLPGDRLADAKAERDAAGEDEGRREIARAVSGAKRERYARKSQRARVTAGRCGTGRVVHRKGRRWYITGRDDTLWAIAERFYGSGVAYPRIYRVNRKRLSSPHVVRPCLALRLPGR